MTETPKAADMVSSLAEAIERLAIKAESLDATILQKLLGGPHGVLAGVPYEGGPTLNGGTFTIHHSVYAELTPAEYARLIVVLTPPDPDRPT